MKYSCPATGSALVYEGTIDENGMPLAGNYITQGGEQSYPVKNGVPDFTYPHAAGLPESDKESLDWYKKNAGVYDEYLPLTFETFGCDEEAERGHLVDLLKLRGDESVLEFGCGTGRDSELIARQMNSKGKLFLQDISPEILHIGVDKMRRADLAPEVYFSLANGYYLPFESGSFDRVFHFGGLNTFGDKSRTFREIVRVSKPGARVVIGDENMPSWLRSSEFGKVLMNSNPHYRYDLPLEFLPEEARNVSVEWIMGGVFYVISFDVGDGVPSANFDFEIPGPRGGTHFSRYYGHLEGVTQEAQQLAAKARETAGKSMHQWLDDVIKAAAKKDIEG